MTRNADGTWTCTDDDINRYIIGLRAMADDEEKHGFVYMAADRREQAMELYRILDAAGYYDDIR